MYFSENMINDIITSVIIKTMKVMKKTFDEGDDLNTIDFDYIIECRKRDLNDPSVLDRFEMNLNGD